MNRLSSPPTAQELELGQGRGLEPENRVDHQNWTLAPFNRWSFQRVQQFTHTVRIPRAENPSLLTENMQDIGSITFENSAGRTISIDDHLQQTWTDGYLVMHRGVVVSEQYFNGMTPSTLHLMMSCSKSLTSTLLGIVQAEGLLDCSLPLTRYLPELERTGMSGATIQQALDMCAGLRFSEDYDDLEADWRDCEVATGYRRPSSEYDGPRDVLTYMQTLRDRVGPHGHVFHYQSILTNAIGLCIERSTGRPFTELFAERIWQPMGAEHDLVTIVDDTGTPAFEGGFNCCLRDFVRFASLICSGGSLGGRQLVPHKWIDECRFPEAELVELFARGEYGEILEGHAYHNQWWVRDPGRGVIVAIGVNGQMLYIDPVREFAAAKFSSQPDFVNVEMVIEQMRGFEAIASSVCD